MRAELKLWWYANSSYTSYLFIEDPENPEGPPYFWTPDRREPLARSQGWLIDHVRQASLAVPLERAEGLFPGVTEALTARWPALTNPYADIDLGPDPEGGY